MLSDRTVPVSHRQGDPLNRLLLWLNMGQDPFDVRDLLPDTLFDSVADLMPLLQVGRLQTHFGFQKSVPAGAAAGDRSDANGTWLCLDGCSGQRQGIRVQRSVKENSHAIAQQLPAGHDHRHHHKHPAVYRCLTSVPQERLATAFIPADKNEQRNSHGHHILHSVDPVWKIAALAL